MVVEDHEQVIHLVTEVLQAVGYEVIYAINGKTAIEMIALEQPSLVLLDIMLPQGLDGFEICGRVRQFSDVPIIMLTAKAQENDKIRGFDVGADDYLTKPFSAKELVARVRAVLRRTNRPEETITSSLVCGDLVINFARHQVKVGGKEVALTRTEYYLLRQLALNIDKVILHRDLLSAVWGHEYTDDIDYLRAYIRYLREKIEKDPANPQYIKTSPGVGYSLVCPDKP